MTRFTVVTLAVLLVSGAVAVALARFFGASGSRGSIILSVTSHWLGAYALWTFAGGLALHYGALNVYDTSLFGLLALGMGFWQYRTRLRAGREPALAIFVGGQLAWLVIVGAQNGLFSR